MPRCALVARAAGLALAAQHHDHDPCHSTKFFDEFFLILFSSRID